MCEHFWKDEKLIGTLTFVIRGEERIVPVTVCSECGTLRIRPNILNNLLSGEQ